MITQVHMRTIFLLIYFFSLRLDSMNLLLERLAAMQKTSSDTPNEAVLEMYNVMMKNLCKEVWPLLAVVGGVNPGLRLGGECVNEGGVKGIICDLPEGGVKVKLQEIFEEGANKLEQK